MDLIVCSAGGLTTSSGNADRPPAPGSLAPHAATIRRESGMAVGLIATPELANTIVAYGETDLVAIGRELRADSNFARRAAEALGLEHPGRVLTAGLSFLSRTPESLLMKRLLPLLALLLAAPSALAQDFGLPGTPSLRERAEAQNAMLKARLDKVIPPLMRRHKVDMWIVAGREYAEDPVLKSMLPATWMSARRRMVLVFHDRGGEAGVERFAVARYPVGDLFETRWEPEKQPDQWARVVELVRERDPKRIAVNISNEFSLADGLTVSQHRQLMAALGPLSERLVSHDGLALGWLETRILEEMGMYRTIMRTAHALLAEGLSEKVITPSVTTTQDVVWWYRERLADLRLDAWCQPSVNILRAAGPAQNVARQTVPEDRLILPGDLLHVDFCAGNLGLKTDTQQLAYVLKPGETEAPRGLRVGMAAANRVQDALTSSFRTGLTGNELLAAARKKAIAQGLEPIIYTHAIGVHGHGAGPWIGRWENQGPLPGMGDYPINPMTAWSIELAAVHKVPEWGGQEVRFPLEVDGFFDGQRFEWIDGRQTELHLIPRQPESSARSASSAPDRRDRSSPSG